jgi:hypothetical protein
VSLANAPQRWIVQAKDESGEWYQVGLKYDDARIAKKRADDFVREFGGRREFRVVPYSPSQDVGPR